jgi:hypothetical protein
MKLFVLNLMLFLQYTTYKHIKERFGDRLWLDVISKCDLLSKTAANNFYCDDNDEELVTGEIGIKEVSDS